MTPIQLFWWRHDDPTISNVGDAMNPMIVEAVSGRPVNHAPIDSCELVAIGSILERAVAAAPHPIHIWGTGFIHEAPAAVPEHLRIAALRGPDSAAQAAVDRPIALGDPGLFADLLLDRRPPRRTGVGVVPHYVDLEHQVIRALAESSGPYTVISPLLAPPTFIEAVAACEVVVSSSLHGLVIADALRVPNRWIELSDRVIGNGFKFRDYFQVFGLTDEQPLKVTAAGQISTELIDEIGGGYERPNLDAVRDALAAAFPL